MNISELSTEELKIQHAELTYRIQVHTCRAYQDKQRKLVEEIERELKNRDNK